MEEFLSLEESLRELYDEIDGELAKAEDQLALDNVTKVGEHLPADLSLTECKSEEVVYLKSLWKKSELHSLFLSSFTFEVHEMYMWRV